MDVEGTDGRERGEDQVNFPYRPTSLGSIFTFDMCRILSARALSSAWRQPKS